MQLISFSLLKNHRDLNLMRRNNLYELPKTATVAYFDFESDKNLTWEEYQQLYPQSEEITIINKSVSNFASEKEEYGPTTLWWCWIQH
ncbi:MAG: hypothetical protein mread185_000200 [Mycoplasmataceae bacterium]|nr:MAG: hypothetical protein mread185_000200 [Mycoplasmataceae bacterium]